MKRRDFIRKSALLAVAGSSAGLLPAAARNPAAGAGNPSRAARPDAAEGGSLIASAPLLQNFAETTVDITFAVSARASGFVRIGRQPGLEDARRIPGGGFRTVELDDRILHVHVSGLEPATTYYYRIGANRIEYRDGRHIRIVETEEPERVYRFTTAGAAARPRFCVINDTHARWEPFALALGQAARLNPSCIVWNGDATNCEETREDLVRIFLNPPVPQADYGAEMPYLFCPGNHDYRGLAGRNLEVVWPFRPAEERAPRDWDLGRNFAVRIGDIALVGLDSGETRLDDDPREAGLLACEPYRIAQTDWLRDALRREDIASAPFLVAFSHVPLLDDDGPAFSREESLAWQKTCAWQWRPLLDEAGCQLVIAAHWHKYQTFPPTDGHPWLQIIGGGPEMGFLGSGDDRQPAPDRFPTVIEGESRDGRLHITVHNLLSGRVQETFSFGPRRRK